MYLIDLDGTALVAPEEVRKIYEQPFSFVVIHTARSESLRQATRILLLKRDIPYHALVMGKPRASLYIDDKNCGGLKWPR